MKQRAHSFFYTTMKTLRLLCIWVLNIGAIRRNQAEVDVTHGLKCMLLKMAATLQFSHVCLRDDQESAPCLHLSLLAQNLWAAQLLLNHHLDRKVQLGHVVVATADLGFMTCMWVYLAGRGLSHVVRANAAVAAAATPAHMHARADKPKPDSNHPDFT